MRLKLNILQIMPLVRILNEMQLDKFYIFPAFTTTDKCNTLHGVLTTAHIMLITFAVILMLFLVELENEFSMWVATPPVVVSRSISISYKGLCSDVRQT